MSAFDAHTHLDDPRFDADRAEVWARARTAGVHDAVIAAADPAHWDRVVAAAEDLGLAWTLGVHPWWVPGLDDHQLLASMRALEVRATPHGIGETGLDYFRATSPDDRRLQARVTEHHLALATTRDVPVVFHCVRAYPDLLALLRERGLPTRGGMIHAWSGASAHVGPAVDLGLYISIGSGVLRSRHVAEAAARVPLERLLLETDAPDQPTVRGARGEPSDLTIIADAVARLRQTPVETLLEATGANARRLFRRDAEGLAAPTP